MQSTRRVGMLSFISLILGFVLLGLFVFPGIFFLALPIGLIFLLLSFILSLFSRRDKFGRISLYAFPIIVVTYVLFFGFMYLFWDTP